MLILRVADDTFVLLATQLLLTCATWRLATIELLPWGVWAICCCLLENANVRMLQTGCSIVRRATDLSQTALDAR